MIQQTQLNSPDSNEIIKSAINLAVDFLEQRQRPSGGFQTFLVPHISTGVPPMDDYSPFPAALMAHCLKFVESDQSKEILAKLISFLKAEMDPRGVWRYFASEHPRYLDSPFDLDDTATSYAILRDNKQALPNNKKLALANRNKAGLFYTWMVPRKEFITSPGAWTYALQELKDLKRIKQFFAVNESALNDVDSVVNANVLYMLGKSKYNQPVVDYLVEIVRSNQEETSDKWHHSKFNLYYFISRNAFAGIESFSTIKDEIWNKIKQEATIDGLIGDSVLTTALAINTLINFNLDSELIDLGILAILKGQNESGAWDFQPLYYGGPSKGCSFGSEELTTAYCVEALSRYKKLRLAA